MRCKWRSSRIKYRRRRHRFWRIRRDRYICRHRGFIWEFSRNPNKAETWGRRYPQNCMGRPNNDRGGFVRVVWDDVVVSGSEDAWVPEMGGVVEYHSRYLKLGLIMQAVYSSIENNYDTGEPVSILPLIKQQTTYYSCAAGVASRRTSIKPRLDQFLLPNSPRRTIENSIWQLTSLSATKN